MDHQNVSPSPFRASVRISYLYIKTFLKAFKGISLYFFSLSSVLGFILKLGKLPTSLSTSVYIYITGKFSPISSNNIADMIANGPGLNYGIP